MTLTKHINAEQLENKLLSKRLKTSLSANEQYIFRYDSEKSVPKYEIPEESSNSTLVYRYLTEELSLDGNPTLNLASFVNTNLTDLQLKLINDNIVKNLADNDEYPSLIDMQQRCVSILSNLWHAPTKIDESGNKITDSIGTATTGSSEAIMLAGLALKRRWQEKRKAQGKSTENPNILMATCAQVALEKFATYFDVENRLIPISEESHHLIDVSKIKENVDENTIGIFVILGSTFTGAFEPVEEISLLLDEIEKETGNDVRIHVDGASGGFVAPFTHPNLKWDFEIPRVDSINTSGHKFGLTSAGLGWVIWKRSELLPKSLKFSLDYLGGVEETFGLNFSRPGFPVITQYFNFLTLGREGYTKLYNSCIDNARLLSQFLEETTYFEVLSVIHKPIKGVEKAKIYTRESTDEDEKKPKQQDYHPGLPVVAFRFTKEIREKYPEIPQQLFAHMLRNKGFIVPNYHLPPNETEKEILRVVVRDSLSLNLLDKLLSDCVAIVEKLIDASGTVRELVAHKDVKPENDHKVIYNLLSKIAAAESAPPDQVEPETQDKGKDGKGYRGPC